MNTQAPTVKEPVAMQRMTPAQVNDPNVMTIAVNGEMPPEQELRREVIGRNMPPVTAPSPEQLIAVAQEQMAAAQQMEGVSQQFLNSAEQTKREINSLEKQQDEIGEQKFGKVKTGASVIGAVVATDQALKWADKNIANADTLVEKGIKTVENTAKSNGKFWNLNIFDSFDRLNKNSVAPDTMKEWVADNLKENIGGGDLTNKLAEQAGLAIDTASKNGKFVSQNLNFTQDAASKEILEKLAENQIKQNGKLFGIEFGEKALEVRKAIEDMGEGKQKLLAGAVLATVVAGTILAVNHHNKKQDEKIAETDQLIEQKEAVAQSWVERAGRTQMYADQSKEAANNIVSLAKKGEGNFRDMIAARNEERALAPAGIT